MRYNKKEEKLKGKVKSIECRDAERQARSAQLGGSVGSCKLCSNKRSSRLAGTQLVEAVLHKCITNTQKVKKGTLQKDVYQSHTQRKENIAVVL